MTTHVHSNLLSNSAKLFGNLVRAHNDLEQAKMQYKLVGLVNLTSVGNDKQKRIRHNTINNMMRVSSVWWS